MPSTNKVVYGNTTLIDLTSDTAIEADVMSGKTFHKANGELATGTASTGKPEQSKTVTATTSQQTVTPDSGYALSSVVVNPQSHSDSYTPAQNKSNNDMGANHNKRYVNTSGMYSVSGSQTITANGTYDIKTKASVTVNIPIKKGSFTATDTITTVNVGFKPKQLFIYYMTPSTGAARISDVYDEDMSTTKTINGWRTPSGSTGLQSGNLNVALSGAIYSIENDGFKFYKTSATSELYYVAIG